MNSIKKFTVVLVSILAVTMTVGVFTSQPAQARATVFITLANCGMFDASGNNVSVLDIEIITQSSNNNITWICQAEFDNPTGKPIKYDAFNVPGIPPEYLPIMCEDGLGGFTEDWKEVISASGQATTTCHFKS